MKQLPANFYEKLYQEIMAASDGIDTSVNDMEVEIVGENGAIFTVELTAIFALEDETDGFLDQVYSYTVVSELERISDVQITYDDEDTEEDVTSLFDYEAFWGQFKQYGTKRQGVEIRPGDEVVVPGILGTFRKCYYRYTDTRTGEHHCSSTPNGKGLGAYNRIFPATAENLALVV